MLPAAAQSLVELDKNLELIELCLSERKLFTVDLNKRYSGIQLAASNIAKFR